MPINAQKRFVNGGSLGKFYIEKLHKLPERRFMKKKNNSKILELAPFAGKRQYSRRHHIIADATATEQNWPWQ